MRIAFAASALSLSLTVLADAPAPSPAADTAHEAAQPAAPGNDDAAKHAKRTACLREAKTKKLVGPDKTAFLKGCIGAP
jgi:hypothetical protein